MTTSLLLLLYMGGLVGLVEGLRAALWGGANVPWWLLWPQGWLILIALCVSWWLTKQKPSLHACVFALAYPIAVLLISMWTATGPGSFETWQGAVDHWYLQFRVDRTGLVNIVVLYALLLLFVVLHPLRKEDLVGKAMAVILVAGEIYMWVENTLCNVVWVVEGAAVVESKMAGTDPLNACSRVNLEYLVWAPASVQIAVMLWLAWMLSRSHKVG